MNVGEEVDQERPRGNPEEQAMRIRCDQCADADERSDEDRGHEGQAGCACHEIHPAAGEVALGGERAMAEQVRRQQQRLDQPCPSHAEARSLNISTTLSFSRPPVKCKNTSSSERP